MIRGAAVFTLLFLGVGEMLLKDLGAFDTSPGLSKAIAAICLILVVAGAALFLESAMKPRGTRGRPLGSEDRKR